MYSSNKTCPNTYLEHRAVAGCSSLTLLSPQALQIEMEHCQHKHASVEYSRWSLRPRKDKAKTLVEEQIVLNNSIHTVNKPIALFTNLQFQFPQ